MESVTQCTKSTPNTDYTIMQERVMGVFDGKFQWQHDQTVLPNIGLELSELVQTELTNRLAHNAQIYDQNGSVKLQLKAQPQNAEWLKNLVALSSLRISTLGSAAFGVCHLTGACGLTAMGAHHPARFLQENLRTPKGNPPETKRNLKDIHTKSAGNPANSTANPYEIHRGPTGNSKKTQRETTGIPEEP